jgi:hypothetical protein
MSDERSELTRALGQGRAALQVPSASREEPAAQRADSEFDTLAIAIPTAYARTKAAAFIVCDSC